jgi:hypothetical protein
VHPSIGSSVNKERYVAYEVVTVLTETLLDKESKCIANFYVTEGIQQTST